MPRTVVLPGGLEAEMRAFPKKLWLTQTYNYKRDRNDGDYRSVSETLKGAMQHVRDDYVAEYRLVGFKKYRAQIVEIDK